MIRSTNALAALFAVGDALEIKDVLTVLQGKNGPLLVKLMLVWHRCRFGQRESNFTINI